MCYLTIQHQGHPVVTSCNKTRILTDTHTHTLRQLSSPEALLTRCVPDLQLDPLAGLDLHQPGEEVHADGGVRHLGEAALREPPDQTRLAHRGVPDDDQPELIEPYRLHDLAAACLSVCRSHRCLSVCLSFCVHERERNRN